MDGGPSGFKKTQETKTITMMSYNIKTYNKKDNAGNIIHNNPKIIPYPKHFKTQLLQQQKIKLKKQCRQTTKNKMNTTPH